MTLALTMTDESSEPDKERLITVGLGSKGQILVVAYTYRGANFRLISARKATASERKHYELQP